MGLKIKVDGVEQKTNAYYWDGGNPPEQNKNDMASNREINNESTDAMWLIVDENRQLKERLYKLEAKLDRVKDILDQ